MAYENILVETRGKVGLITLNRPQALNALSPALMRELGSALLAYEADDAIRALVLPGTEKAFGGPYVGGNIAGTQAYVKANRQTVKAFNKAIVRTLKWMQTHTAAQIVDALPKQIYYPNPEDKDIMVKSFQASKDFYSGDGTLTEVAARNVVRNLKIANPKLEFDGLDLASTYDNSLVKE